MLAARIAARIVTAALALCTVSGAACVSAGEYRSIGENGTVLYDAPSTKAKKMFVASRYYPVEIMVNIDQWVRVRDVAGDLVWVEKKALSELRTVVVTAATADIRDKPADSAAVVFRAQQGVALELAESTGAGWARVKHRDGQTGFVRINQVWGL